MSEYDVDRGPGGGAPRAPAPCVAGCHFYYASLADFQAALLPNVGQIQADIPDYTDILPVIQISEVLATVPHQ